MSKAMAPPSSATGGSKGLRLNTDLSRRPGGTTYSPMTPLAGKNTEFGMLEAAMAMPKSHRSTAPSSLSLGDQTPVQSSATCSFKRPSQPQEDSTAHAFDVDAYYAAMHASNSNGGGSFSAPPILPFPSIFAEDLNVIMASTKLEQGLASAPPMYGGDYHAQLQQQYHQAAEYAAYMQHQQQFAIPGNFDFSDVANFTIPTTTEEDVKPDISASYEVGSMSPIRRLAADCVNQVYNQGMPDFATTAVIPQPENMQMNGLPVYHTEQGVQQQYQLFDVDNNEASGVNGFSAPQNHIIAPVPIITPSLPVLAGFNVPSPAATPSSISSSQPSTPDAAAYSSDDSSVIARSELSITSSNGSKQRTGRRVSSSIREKDKSSKKFICSYPGCKQGFSRNFNLSTHYNTHLGVKPFPCTHCPKSFSRRHDCGRHIAAVHSNAGKKLCSCGCSKHNAPDSSTGVPNGTPTFYPNACILHNPADGQPVYYAASQHSGSSASISSLADLTPKLEAEG